MKNIPTDRRRLPATAAPSGLTTRCGVETQRSFVHRIIKSPMLTMNVSGTAGA